MVNNFQQIRSLLRFEEDGDCYYVQLLRRSSDDPMIDGKPSPEYHGNMHSRSIKDYFISSLEHFDNVSQEIKELCDMFNVRAYIRLNRRSYKKISLQMLRHIAEQASSGESYSSPYHLVSSAAGKTNNEPNKTWIVDLDECYLDYEHEILDMISKCKPTCDSIKTYMDNGFSHEDALDKWISSSIVIVPTKHGKHIIVSPFNIQEFFARWTAFSTDRKLGLNAPDIHKDNPTILFCP